MSIEQTRFGTLADGRPVWLFTMRSSAGIEVMVTNYGGRITRMRVPDARGNLADVALGFDRLEPYLNDNLYFGPIVGRYALRIAGGSFELNGVTYTLPKNEGDNTLHGGPFGFDKRLWSPDALNGTESSLLRLTYFSPGGEEGFPGDVMTAVIYELKHDEFRIEYTAHTDQPTPLSFTNHVYLNLVGAGTPSVLDHVVTIPATEFLATTQDAVPTGQVLPVAGTELDFTSSHAIGQRIGKGLATVDGGYDHYYLLARDPSDVLHAAHVQHPASGRTLDFWTDWPGFEFYTGNKLDGSIHGIGGKYVKHCAFTVEPMWFPDSMHHPNFPPAILQPGQTLRRRTHYRFGAI